jgi:hypothetical protein
MGGDGAGPDEAGAGVVTLGNGVEQGEQPQHLVPGGVWQTAEPAGNEPVRDVPFPNVRPGARGQSWAFWPAA